VPGYGHIDCMFGKDAVVDVYPIILGHLEKTALG
jgi:cholesterol oxidase